MQWLIAMHSLAGAHVAALRDRWAARPDPSSVHEVVDEIVSVTEAPWPQALQQAADTARAALAADSHWTRLAGALDLAAGDLEWLALLAACELNPRLTRVLGYLDDTMTPTPPSPALASVLWNWPLGHQPGPGSKLVHWQVATPLDGWQSTTPWGVDADVVAFLAGCEDWIDIRGDASPSPPCALDCLHPGLLEEMRRAVSAVTTAGCEVELVGPAGSGRRSLLVQLGAALGRDVAFIRPDSGMRGLRAARLLDAVPLWVSDDEHEVQIDARAAALTFTARSTPAATRPDGAVRLSWTMPVTRPEQRERLWAAVTSAPVPRIVTEWDLTPAEVRTGAAAAAAGQAVASGVLRNCVRRGAHRALSALALPYDWDDLVVQDHVESALRRLCNEVLFRRDVLDEWEFRRLCPTTAGVTALFAGPSGTGKTMAAQVLARALDLDLLRVDLATVVSKYIGETEKQLAAVFDDAERSNVLVLFDEADALFGQRTKVHDAHDRYANIEIDFLLQRLDTFRGVAILATNRKTDLDQAFLRRLRTVVDFVPPAPPQRLRLWQLALPPHTSGGAQITENLDHQWLAGSLELTGAEIKSVALSAAFEARATGAAITLQHVLDASRRELGKRGLVLRVEPPLAVAT
jgi:hypothetical protein